MIFVDNLNHHDASLNLALEEYVLRNAQTDEDMLLFYINAPSIIIGRHQNTHEEINQRYCEEKGIRVVRRLSGGGAVYHDLGNLNFSFITESAPENFRNFKKFTEPVIRCLANYGVKAELSGRNDILVDERKISGNAQYISRGRMASHGTLLLHTDLSEVGKALNVPASKIVSKGIKSVRSRVANISEFLSQPLTTEELKQGILEATFNSKSHFPTLPLTDEDWVKVQELADSRYRTWAWNFGHSPDFNLQKKERFTAGEVDIRMDVSKGVIQSIKFYGDFFAMEPIEVLEEKLTGVPYRRDALDEALAGVAVEKYISGLDNESLVNFML